MSKLTFGEVKQDYKNGYDYREYETQYRNYQVTTILNIRDNTVCVYTEGYHYTLIMEIPEFMQLSYLEYRKKFNEFMFYNPPVEIEEIV